MPKLKKPATSKRKPAPSRTPEGVRQLQLPKRIWYKPLTWRYTMPAPVYKPLPKARHLFATTVRQLWQHKRLFGGIILIYGLLNLLLVRGLSGSSNLGALKSLLDSITTGFTGKLITSLAGFGYLLATSGSGNAQTSSLYQSILFIVCSLAFIWALRQVLAKHVVRIRDGFYEGMYPLIPFMLILLMLCVQLVPMLVGGGLYQRVMASGIAVHLWEKALWIVLFIVLAVWSLRMLVGTVFALYIVMLPNMTPFRALRSAKQLVYGRRLLVLRKLVFLPVCMLLLAILVEVPLILLATPVAAWVFFVLTMLALPTAHGYLYNLYREML